MKQSRILGIIFSLVGLFFLFSPDQVRAVGVDQACALSGSTGTCKTPSQCNGGSALGAGGGCDAGLICCKKDTLPTPTPAPVPPVSGGASCAGCTATTCTGSSGRTGVCYDAAKGGCTVDKVEPANGGACGLLNCCVGGVAPTPAPAPGGGATCVTPNVCKSAGCPTGWKAVTGDCKDGGASTCCGLIADPSGSSVNFFNPLKFSTVDGVLTSVLEALQGIIVILAIIFIIIGALIYITSAGNDSRMSLAKGAIMAALIGLALALAAPSFLKEIGSILGWTDVNNATVASAQTFTQIASKVLNFLLSIAGIIAIIMLIFGGFTYLTSAGDESKAEAGKKIALYAVIGIALALSALVLVTQVAKFFA